MPSAAATAKPSTSKAPADGKEVENWIDNVLGGDGPNSATKQMVLGGVSGW